MGENIKMTYIVNLADAKVVDVIIKKVVKCPK